MRSSETSNAADALRKLDEKWLKEDHGWDSGPYDVGETFMAWTLVPAVPELIALLDECELLYASGVRGQLRERLDALAEKLQK